MRTFRPRIALAVAALAALLATAPQPTVPVPDSPFGATGTRPGDTP